MLRHWSVAGQPGRRLPSRCYVLVGHVPGTKPLQADSNCTPHRSPAPVLAGIAVLALSFFRANQSNQATARELAAYGKTSTTTASRVHVHYVSGKGGGFYEVDDADAHLPARTGPIRLRGLTGPSHDGDIDFATEQEGWQKLTADSG